LNKLVVCYSLCLCVVQNAGENSVANIDKLRHSNGTVSPAVLRLKMQKVISDLSY